MTNATPSWADKVAGMIDPHLHVSPSMYRQLKDEAMALDDHQERPFNFYRAAGAIPIHVEKYLPFTNAEGEEVHLVALDHGNLARKEDAEPEEQHRWWFPPRFEFGAWAEAEKRLSRPD